MRRVLIGMIASLFVLLPAVAADQVPDGTIELTGGSVSAGIGYTWGKGHLVFQGKTYQLKINGLSVVDIGASNYTASGTVYNLKKVKDIEGNYTAGEASGTVAGGAGGTIMKNQNGVKIELTATRQGLQFTLAAQGLNITLVK